MASINVVFSLVHIFFFLLASPFSNAGQILKTCGFDAIYKLGDSTSDTGNLIREKPGVVACERLPYGVTFNKNATGRCSDGLLMIDYFAQSAGLPFLDPYLSLNGSHKRDHGVNFAVAGSTALPEHILSDKNFSSPFTNSSISHQLNWMYTYFDGICSKKGADSSCYEKNRKSLFMVGEIGENDYTYALIQGKTLEQTKEIVPDVIHAVKEAVIRVIGYGATRVVVPGHFPNGCIPFYLTEFKTSDSAAYDEFHCLKDLNNFSSYHNEHLQQVIEKLRKEYPSVTIVYADYYNAFQWILRDCRSLGFDASSLQKVCCGTGGEYNYSNEKKCGDPGVPVCPKPNERINWDGIHLTQRTYQYMASWLIRDIFPKFQCSMSSSTSSSTLKRQMEY